MFKKFGLGFGFNKEKVRANAERYLQQNKLPNAIAEYEKILKVEPNDLTIVNQIGDIYSRLGQTDKAVERFRHVGDCYIHDGSFVKAIAMYKKISKLDTNALPAMEKLAELYRKQGLVNDARSMLLQVADAFTKRGQSKETLRILKQLVLFDPENVQVISRTAELMTQAGQKSEAKDMLSQTASTLVERHALEPAQKILEKLIAIDAGNQRAQELRAQVTLELGDAAQAAELFEAIPDLDSRPDALRNLVYAQVAMGKLDEASVVSRKLVTVHHDAEGVLRVADALYKEGEVLRSIQLYEEFFAELISVDQPSVLEHLRGAVARVRTNAEALQSLYNLFQRAGDTSMNAELLELMAHACVQNGQIERAREIFEQLIELEPDNAAHQQEYRQVCARLDPNAQGLTSAAATTPRSLEEFRSSTEPELPPQNYAPEVADTISAALTEAELYESLSSKAQAVTVLERALQKTPEDLRLNYMLGRLYRQEGNGSKAARCYFTMQRVLEELGQKPAADYYADLALSAGKITNTWEAHGGEFSASEFKLDDALGGTSEFSPAEFTIEDDALGGTEEIDLSDEWQSVWQDDASDHVATKKPGRAAAASALSASKIPELLEEAHFCLTQQIWDEAESAINNLARVFPEHPELEDLRARLKRGKEKPAAAYGASGTASAAPEVEHGNSYGGSSFYGSAADPELEISGTRSSGGDALSSLAADLDRALGDEFIPADQGARPSPATPSPTARKVSAPQPAAPPAAEAEPEPQSSVFGDLLQDFERELGTQSSGAGNGEDPETHFSLGMAFRDMGLLDEAIGELQKVCRQSKSMKPQRAHQAYVWLATCFVEKSVPEASFKWFERALETAPDEESHNAVNYELANAYEAAGCKKEALERFLEVYGSNIDYRDVASRIRDLRAAQ